MWAEPSEEPCERCLRGRRTGADRRGGQVPRWCSQCAGHPHEERLRKAWARLWKGIYAGRAQTIQANLRGLGAEATAELTGVGVEEVRGWYAGEPVPSRCQRRLAWAWMDSTVLRGDRTPEKTAPAWLRAWDSR